MQFYTYVVIDFNTECILGSYKTFKEAYECIEKRENGKVIYDEKPDAYNNLIFEAIRLERTSYGYYAYRTKYAIYRSLITVQQNDTTISFDEVHALIDEYDTKKHMHNYKIPGDFVK